MPQTLLTKPATAESVYDEAVQALPSSEQLKLATLILSHIAPLRSTADNAKITDDEDEDLRLITQASMRYVVQSFGEDEHDLDDA